MLFANLIENRLKLALPKIVSPAIIAEIMEAINTALNSPVKEIFAKMLAPAAPAKMPHTSPITSAQIELTLSAFLTKAIACLLPLTLREAIALKSSMFAEAHARPNISKNMLIAMKSRIIIIETTIDAFVKVNSLSKLKVNDKKMAKIKILIGHNQVFEFEFLFLGFFINVNKLHKNFLKIEFFINFLQFFC